MIAEMLRSRNALTKSQWREAERTGELSLLSWESKRRWMLAMRRHEGRKGRE